jgi:DNA polymerase elongation subunit (family B)
MILEIKQRPETNDLTFSYVDKSGEIRHCVCPIIDRDRKIDDNFNWVECSANDNQRIPGKMNWNGRCVKRSVHSVFDAYDKSKTGFEKLTQSRCMEIIQSRYGGDFLDEVNCFKMPKMTFIDIETGMSEDGFERPETAGQPVTVIGMATESHEITVFGTRVLNRDEQDRIQYLINEHTKSLPSQIHFDFKYKYFAKEEDMLECFFREMKHMGMISGWNVVEFDWAYLYNRGRILGKNAKYLAGEFNMLSGKDNIPTHIPIVDYMECYRKWDRSVEQKENYKLDQAGYDVLKMQKVHFDGSLQDLYERDFPMYVYYNAIDCILVEQLHERLRLADIGCTLAWIAKTPVNRMMSVVATTEGALTDAYRRSGRVVADSKWKAGKDAEGYEGAFVKEPVVGLHLYVSCNDFASLYPNIIRTLNMSPETFYKKVDEDDTVAKEKWKKKGYIVSESGCVFQPNTTPGVFATLIGDLYKQRKAFKKKSYVCADKQRRLEELAERIDLTDEEALAEMHKILGE